MKRVLMLAAILSVGGCENPYNGIPVSDYLDATPKTVLGKRIESSFDGECVSITNGDTIVVLDDQNQHINIRLDSIDCPEIDQPYGQMATAVLSDMVHEKYVQVWVTGKDHEGRTLAFVQVPGFRGRVGEELEPKVTVNEAMVQGGCAWNCREHSKSEKLANLEDQARVAKRGLWSSEGPEEQVPPWKWRQR